MTDLWIFIAMVERNIEIQVNSFKENGYCVLGSVFNQSEIESFRSETLKNLHLMGQTRPNPYSYHLAGFHRFPSLSALHLRIFSDPIINKFLSCYYDSSLYYEIGLSDATVNRSQQWHTDLLRGKYAEHLKGCKIWERGTITCIKALVYLQQGKSLQIIPRSHLSPLPLDDSSLERIAISGTANSLKINTGEVIMMDVRLLHRGSGEDEMRDKNFKNFPKILLSTVFGQMSSPFALAMQLGNNQRMLDWDRRNLTMAQQGYKVALN